MKFHRFRLTPLIAVAAMALFWLGASYYCAGPLLDPRGTYGWGHYRLVDLYVGFPLLVASLAVTAVAACPERNRRSLTIRLIVAIASATLATVVLDVGATVVRYQLSRNRRWDHPDPVLRVARNPHISLHFRASWETYSIHYRTDQHGFRNSTDERSADVMFVGDSFTEAYQVDEPETFVRRYARMAGARVVNLGRAGYGPQQELAVIENLVPFYHPRLVVWQLFEGE